MSDKKKKKAASLGCLFWIAIILLIIVLFFLKRNTIAAVLEKTGASELLFNRTHTVDNSNGDQIPSLKLKEPDLTPLENKKATEKPSSALPETPTPVPENVVQLLPPEAPPKKTDTTEIKKTDPAVKIETPVKPTEKPAVKPVAKPAEKPAETRKATLFLVSIDADGRIIRKEVSRNIPKTNSPLVENLNALFAGPTAAEEKKGIRTLIPEGTKLLSASVKDGVATLNINENFRFNQFGIEGYLGQLAQIVFTATAFPTVTSVQFLIEGQRREYLGAEGVWIGTPLSRDKF